MTDPTASKSPDSEVGSVVESFLARFRKGERPALTELVARHPDLAEQLRELIPALVELEQLGSPTGSFTGGRADGVATVEAAHPVSLGDYKILRRIGGGGMGVVYEAERESLKSRVALKVMHPRFRADEKFLRRFHVEARSAAGLHHTNIVGVFDYGEQGGVCYYAMQYIRGQPLDFVLEDLRRLRADGRDLGASEPLRAEAPPTTRDQRLVAQGLLTGRFAPSPSAAVAITQAGPIEPTLVLPLRTVEDTGEERRRAPDDPSSFGSSSLSGSVEGRYYREVARVGTQVADALDHAHRAGVLHRDIKPSNLLLDALGNVWVTDFGLAKLENGEDASRSQDLVGTLRYMAPERFRGVSGRSGDVYALGATLYEMATLRPTFEGTDQLRLIDQIVHEPPVRPRLIDRHVPRDLETIILKALAKDPADRFGSAREMAEELRKFVSGHPIRSRPISSAERFYRWCRRNPWLAAANISAAAMTTALAIGSTIAAKIYRDDQQRLAVVARDARERLFDAKVSQARASRFSRQVGQRFESLEALLEAAKIGRELKLPAERFDPLRDQAIASLMLADLKPAGRPIPLPEANRGFDFDEGMTRYAFRQVDGTIVVRRVDDNREIARIKAKGDIDIWVFDLSPDGRFLASRDGDSISVWDVDRKSLVWTVPGVLSQWISQFSPDSHRIAVSFRDGTILLYDLETGQSRSWAGPAANQALTFRPDGAQIAACYGESPPLCRILDAETGQQLRAFSIPDNRVTGIAWSLDGSTLAIRDFDQRVALYSASTGERGAVQKQANHGMDRLGFHPAGTLLATNSWENRLRLSDPASGQERLSLSCIGGDTFSRDGRIFVRQGNDWSIRQVDPAVEYTSLVHAPNELVSYRKVSIHRDGRILAVGTSRGVIFWDLAHKTELGFLPIGLASNSMFEPSGDLLTNSEAGVLRWAVRRDPTSGEVRIGPPRALLLQAGPICWIDTDRTGQIVAGARFNEAQVELGGQIIKLRPLEDSRNLSLSPDGKWLATNHHAHDGLTIWSLPDRARFTLETGTVPRFSPDGKWLATDQGGSSRLWEVGSWREIRQIEGVLQDFSPDGRLGIALDSSNVLRLIEIETGRILARLERPDQQVVWFTFSTDGSRLVGTTHDPPSAQVIDLRLIRRGLARMGLDWEAPAFPEEDPARPDLPPLSPAQVDYGFLTPHLEHFSEDPEPRIARYTKQIKQNPNDADAYHHRAHALMDLDRWAEAVNDLSRAISLRPNDAHFLHSRAQIHFLSLRKPEPAIADLELALKLDPSRLSVRNLLAECCNDLAWNLAANSRSRTGLEQALRLSLRAVELEPDHQMYLNTRGVVLYRAGQFAEAVTVLEKNLKARKGHFDSFDLYFLAMTHHRLGHRVEARHCFDRADGWVSRQASLPAHHAKELAAFRAEAEAVLNGPTGELPDDVFEPPKSNGRPSP